MALPSVCDSRELRAVPERDLDHLVGEGPGSTEIRDREIIRNGFGNFSNYYILHAPHYIMCWHIQWIAYFRLTLIVQHVTD